ncbi:hypothetical protein BGZ81_010735, partial [Podila clonocystis]
RRPRGQALRRSGGSRLPRRRRHRRGHRAHRRPRQGSCPQDRAQGQVWLDFCNDQGGHVPRGVIPNGDEREVV